MVSYENNAGARSSQIVQRRALLMWTMLCSVGCHTGVLASAAVSSSVVPMASTKALQSQNADALIFVPAKPGVNVAPKAPTLRPVVKSAKPGVNVAPKAPTLRPVVKSPKLYVAPTLPTRRYNDPRSLIADPSYKEEITTLEQALTMAYSFNIEIINAFVELQKAQEQCFVARADWLPTVSVNGGFSLDRKHSDVHKNVNTIADVSMRSFKQKELARNIMGNLKIAYNLYQGGSSKAKSQQSFDAYKAAYWSLMDRIQRTLLETVGAFVAVAKAQEVYLLAKTREKSLNAEALITAKRAVSGDKRTVDASLARANAIQKTIEVNGSHQAYLDAKGKLEAMIGRPVSSSIVFPKPLKLPMWTNATMKKASLKTHPSIKVGMYRTKAAQSEVLAIKGSLAPRVDVAFTVGHDDNWEYDTNIGLDRYPDLQTQLRRGVRLDVSMPLFDGGEKQAQIRRSQLQVKQNRLEVESAKRQLILKVDATLLAYDHAQQDIESALEAQKEQGAVFAATREEYELGGTSLLDLISLEDQYTRMAKLVVDAYGNIVYYSYAVLELLGKLHPDHLMKIAVSSTYDIQAYREQYAVNLYALGPDQSKTSLYDVKKLEESQVGSSVLSKHSLLNPPTTTTLHIGWYPESFSLGSTEATPPIDQEMKKWLDGSSAWDLLNGVRQSEEGDDDHTELKQLLHSVVQKPKDSPSSDDGGSKSKVDTPNRIKKTGSLESSQKPANDQTDVSSANEQSQETEDAKGK